MSCLENKSVCKGGFVFVMITEIFWRTFWRDDCRSLIGVVENFRLSDHLTKKREKLSRIQILHLIHSGKVQGQFYIFIFLSELAFEESAKKICTFSVNDTFSKIYRQLLKQKRASLLFLAQINNNSSMKLKKTENTQTRIVSSFSNQSAALTSKRGLIL